MTDPINTEHEQALVDLLAGLSDDEIDHIAQLAEQANGEDQADTDDLNPSSGVSPTGVPA